MGKKVVIISVGKLKAAHWSSTNATQFLLRLFEGDKTHSFSNIKESDLDALMGLLKEFKVDIRKIPLCFDAKHWGSMSCEGQEIVFSKENDGIRFTIPHSSVTNIAPAGKADIQFDFEEPSEHFEGDYVQEIRFFVPPLDGMNQVEELHEEIMQKCDKRAGQSVADLGDFKFMMPSARYELQIFRDYLRLHGRSFDHNVKFKEIDQVFLVETPRSEALFVFGLVTPLRQGNTSFNYIVMQIMDGTTININVNLDAEEVTALSLPNSQAVYNPRDLLGKLVKFFTKKPIAVPCENFASDNKKHCMACTYRQSMGYLWILNKSFLYGARPVVHIPFTHISKIRVTPPPDGGRCFDLEVKVANGHSHEFSRIEKEDFQAFMEFAQKAGIQLQREGEIAQEQPIEEDDEDDDDQDSDWEPSSPAETKRKRR